MGYDYWSVSKPMQGLEMWAPTVVENAFFELKSQPCGPFLPENLAPQPFFCWRAKSESNSTVIQCTPPLLPQTFISYILYIIFVGYSYLVSFTCLVYIVCIVPGGNVVKCNVIVMYSVNSICGWWGPSQLSAM